MTYKYSVEKSSDGIVHCQLCDVKGVRVWEAYFPSFSQTPDGDLEEDFNLVELGAMKSFNDVEGLKNYLTVIGVISSGDKIN